MKYGIVSDIHAHTWSAFSHLTSAGTNIRLEIILLELLRAAEEVINQDGKVLIVAGDIFHTRGSIDPEVLNPVREVFEKIVAGGVSIYILPGNHDLKSNDTRKLSSAVQNLEQINVESGAQVLIINDACAYQFGLSGENFFGFVPWRHTHDALMKDLEELSKHPKAANMDVFIHAGIDGVLSGMPSGSLTPAKLAAFGFRHVFAGHYHNHADLGDGIISIGATTHQTWSDVGTRAGFLIVEGDTGEVKFHDTRAPKFVDISDLDEDEMMIETPGNYVRFRGPQMTQAQINDFRDELKKWGALGVSIQVPVVTAVQRTTAPAKGLSLEQSVGAFVDDLKELPVGGNREDLKRRAVQVLNDSRSVSTEA